jgi:hypothetical protein
MIAWEQGLTQAGWIDYVKANNSLAEQFVLNNPSGDDHAYVLTTSSWREHVQSQELQKKRN